MRELWNSHAASARLLIKLGEEVVLSAHFYTKKALQKYLATFFSNHCQLFPWISVF